MGDSISKSCCIASDYQDLTATQNHHGHEIITTIRVPKIRRDMLLYQDSFDREKRRLEAQVLSEEKEAKRCRLHKKQLDATYWNKKWKKIVEDKDYAKIVRAELARKNEDEKSEAETAACSWKPRIPTSRKMTANSNSRIRAATMASRNLAFCSEDNKSVQEWQESLRKPDSKRSPASTATTNPIMSNIERKETSPHIRKSSEYFVKATKDQEYLDIPDETEIGNTLSTNATAFMESGTTNLEELSDSDLPRYCSSPVPSVRLPDIQPSLVQPLIHTATRPIEQTTYQSTIPHARHLTNKYRLAWNIKDSITLKRNFIFLLGVERPCEFSSLLLRCRS
eukprot:GHVP01011604.1.p3 GENE.GHVP01011604.1~~GHVP01011604.1.p3  ORF type:complete len:338 (+),score=54.32 GHVP01011604.1:4580-5593(+)